jgi:hypothetical protein
LALPLVTLVALAALCALTALALPSGISVAPVRTVSVAAFISPSGIKAKGRWCDNCPRSDNDAKGESRTRSQ